MLTAAGLSLADLLRLEAAAKSPGSANDDAEKSVILLWMDGGASQHDTFDPKPDAPAEIRGEFQPIATAVPGIQICEGLPQTAKLTDRLAIIRSLHHEDGLHEGAIHWLQTGYGYSGEFNPTDQRHARNPSIGSIVAYDDTQARRRDGRPIGLPYVKVFKDGGYSHSYQQAAFLGKRYDPLEIGGDLRQTAFRETKPFDSRHLQAPALRLPDSMTLDRINDRRVILAQLDARRREFVGERFDDLDTFRKQAFGLLGSKSVQEAFDISREKTAQRERYGAHLWGQGTLLARRLVESGVRFVTVNLHGDPLVPSPFSWDTHVAHFPAMKNYLLPAFDQLFSALVEDIWQRGLQDQVLVVAVGEFGRTPKIASDGRPGGPGRAHWPQAFSAVLAGGGVRGGQVIGSTDAHGAVVKDRPLTPEDLLATVYHHLGIDPHATIRNQLNRPVPILPSGEPIRELV